METEEKQIPKLDLETLLGDYFKIAKRHLVLCLALIILLGAFFGYRSYRSYVPVYTANATFSVRVADPLYGDISTYNSATAEQMAKTFPHILTSGVLQERVKKHLNIPSMPSVSVTANTTGSLITIQVTDRDPELALKVLNAVMVYYPEIAEYVVGPTVLVLLHESGLPTAPVNPLNIKNAVIKGALIGFAIWAVIILVMSLMVNTIHDEKELKNLVNTPCIGQIPHIRRSSKKGGKLLYQQVRSPGFNEAVRMLRIRVEKALAEEEKKVLLVSSAIPGEGKTTVSANLAIALAHKGKKVLLIDCDLRNPSVGKTLGIIDPPMIGAYLTDRADMESVIMPTEYKNLSVACGGVNKAVSMKSVHLNRRLAEMVKVARERYDVVIMDTPPCSLLADASEYASMADYGLMVVRQEYASREQIIDGVQCLSDAKLPLIGCAMNHVRGSNSRSYGYGYGKSYGYGYGYGYGYDKSYGYGEKKK